jgi:uncharacterized membrane protein
LSENLRQARRRWIALALIVALAAMSNLAFVTAGLTFLAATRAPSLFLPADLFVAMDWLGANTSWQETVLSGYTVGDLIPARIGHRVVMGHESETLDFETKQAAVAHFFAATTSDDERLGLLEQYRVAYVFHGPYEQALGGFDPAKADYLTLVFTRNDVSVYRVNLSYR